MAGIPRAQVLAPEDFIPLFCWVGDPQASANLLEQLLEIPFAIKPQQTGGKGEAVTAAAMGTDKSTHTILVVEPERSRSITKRAWPMLVDKTGGIYPQCGQDHGPIAIGPTADQVCVHL